MLKLAGQLIHMVKLAAATSANINKPDPPKRGSIGSITLANVFTPANGAV